MIDNAGQLLRRSNGRIALRIVGLWVLPIAAAISAYWYWHAQQRYAKTDNAYVKSDKVIVAAEVDGRILNVLVHENDRVRAGQPILELDPESLRYDVTEARAEVETERVRISTLRAQYAEKQAALELARRSAQFAHKEFRRKQELENRKLIAATELDDADRAAVEADGAVALAERDLAALAAQLGGRPDLPIDAHPDVKAAEAKLARSEWQLRQAVINAPRDGMVSKLPMAGSYVTRNGPAFAIVANDPVWIEANFKETDLGKVREGQPVAIEIDTYARHAWHGRVESIAQATGAEFALLPPQNASGNWVKVVQRIPVRISVERAPDDPPLRAGMSATVKIDTAAAGRQASPAGGATSAASQ
ncbi:MAG: HlyD family secretion protein [Steroidobacteraceae bacterium]